MKVAILHFGPIEDHGWTYEAHLGALEMARSLTYVDLVERENASGQHGQEIMREYGDAGYEVIFCHSWTFGQDIEQVAPDYPDTIFMWGSGNEKKAPNAGYYYGRMYEGRYLTGVLAGIMTETNKTGYAAAMNTSEVLRGINAFARGVASVNPNATVHVKWIGDWYDPEKEKNITYDLIDKGCDVVTHHSDSYGSGEAAEERNVSFISFHSDTRIFAPNVFLTGVIWNWTPIFIDVVESVKNGTWDRQPDSNWWYGLVQGGVKLAPFSDRVPAQVQQVVEEKEQMIIENELEVYPGMTDKELLFIDYLESNVVMMI